MSALHPTTAALLLAARKPKSSIKDAWEERGQDWEDWRAVAEALFAWRRAGEHDAPVPRFVPTEPGVYHRKDEEHPVMVTRGKTYAALVGGIPVNHDVTDDGLWLGPVAPWPLPSAHPDPGPCLPKPRTAEEARKEPMPGDRWACGDGPGYTVIALLAGGWWRALWDDGRRHDYSAVCLGEPGETYLGHFPLETP